MKKLLKSIIAAILCTVIAITSIGTYTAYAADKIPLKVTFNKKSVTFSKDINENVKKINLKTLKKKWGNPKTETYDDFTAYTWTKGKTEIRYASMDRHSNITFNIQDKNSGICGIKFGMKESTALKKLKKMGIKEPNELIEIPLSNVTTLIYYFKNGKVSRISCTAYIITDDAE